MGIRSLYADDVRWCLRLRMYTDTGIVRAGDVTIYRATITPGSSTLTYYYPTPTEEYPRNRSRTSGALVFADIVALIGVVVGSVPLFLHGWVNAKLTFLTSGTAGSQILQQFGVDVNQELSRIADREIQSTIEPTMWQHKGHAFQYLFALLVLTGVLLLIALIAPRARIPLHIIALFTSVGAVVVMIVALLRLRDRMDTLPARVAQAVLNSPITNRVLALTTGKPQLDAKPGWPIYAAAAGVALTLLGALCALIIAALRSSRNAAVVR